MNSRYRKRRRVVSMTVSEKEDTKEVPEVDMGMVMDEDMAEDEC
jgi:hypothetical protein